jgi:hypothetical protein
MSTASQSRHRRPMGTSSPGPIRHQQDVKIRKLWTAEKRTTAAAPAAGSSSTPSCLRLILGVDDPAALEGRELVPCDLP